MKRINQIICLSLLCLLPACQKSQEQSAKNDNQLSNEHLMSDKVSSSNLTKIDSKPQVVEKQNELLTYFPFYQDEERQYTGDGIEFSSYSERPEFIDHTYFQTRINNSGTAILNLYQITDSQVNLLAAVPEMYVRENYIGRLKDRDVLKVLIKKPLEVGNHWKIPDGEREITDLDVEITVGVKTYQNALEITERTKDTEHVEYYVPHIGLVKQIDKLKSNDNSKAITITSQLKSQSQDGWIEDFTLYTKDGQQTIQLQAKTNQPLKESLNALFHGDLATPTLLDPEVTIQKLYGHRDQIDNPMDMRLTIDFSSAVASKQDSESFYAVLKTLAHYYGSDELYVSADGQAFTLKDGTTFSPNKAYRINLNP